MALNLVPYGDSDLESNDSDYEGPSVSDEKPGKRLRTLSPSPKNETLIESSSTSGYQNNSVNNRNHPDLPSGKSTSSVSEQSLSKSVHIDKHSKKIIISLPSIEDFDLDSSDDEDIKPTIKSRASSAGSCRLISMLPKPSNTLAPSSTLSFVPYTLTKSKPQPPKIVPVKDNIPSIHQKPIPSELYKSSSSHDLPGDNPKSSRESSPPIPKSDPELSYNDILMKKLAEDGQLSASDNDDTDEEQPVIKAKRKKSALPTNLDINDPEYKKIIAKRFGEETADEINVVDVNVSNYLRQNNDYIKSISMERPAEPSGPAPNSTAKRKHQITYLAYQAKQREVDLKNQAAANRQTKSQSRARYGF